MSKAIRPDLGRPPFRRRVETEELIAAARKLKKGETLSIEAMVAMTRLSVAGLRNIMPTVIKAMMQEGKRLRFCPRIYGGLRYLTDSENADESVAGGRAVPRMAKRLSDNIATIDMGQLSDQKRADVNTTLVMVRLHEMFGGKRKEVAKLIAQSSEVPSIGQTLTKLFAPKTNGD